MAAKETLIVVGANLKFAFSFSRLNKKHRFLKMDNRMNSLRKSVMLAGVEIWDKVNDMRHEARMRETR